MYLFVARLSHMALDHASLSRWSTVHTPSRGTLRGGGSLLGECVRVCLDMRTTTSGQKGRANDCPRALGLDGRDTSSRFGVDTLGDGSDIPMVAT